jgi:hypothetical protein
MDINKITDVLLSAFNMPSAPVSPIPPILVLSGSNLRSGLSARAIASRIISRQSEAGAPVGAMPDGSPNISEAMEVIRMEELINALVTESRIEIAIYPGVPVTAVGANSGGPVVVNGATISYGKGFGIIR